MLVSGLFRSFSSSLWNWEKLGEGQIFCSLKRYWLCDLRLCNIKAAFEPLWERWILEQRNQTRSVDPSGIVYLESGDCRLLKQRLCFWAAFKGSGTLASGAQGQAWWLPGPHRSKFGRLGESETVQHCHLLGARSIWSGQAEIQLRIPD